VAATTVVAAPSGRLPAVAPSPGHAPAAGTHGHHCAPAGCPIGLPTAEESRALADEADRIVTRFAHDATPLGRACHALGTAMRAHVGDVRMLAYMWRVPDRDGRLAPVTGDAHRVEPTAGAGTVHIARGFDPLNPDRGLPAILETARHEFAHLNGSGQAEAWGLDAAAQLANACGPAADGI
jgi:hypothetical protein